MTCTNAKGEKYLILFPFAVEFSLQMARVKGHVTRRGFEVGNEGAPRFVYFFRSKVHFKPRCYLISVTSGARVGVSIIVAK